MYRACVGLLCVSWAVTAEEQIWQPPQELVQVGYQQQLQGRYETAATFLREAAKSAPAGSLEQAYFWNRLGGAHLDLGQFHEAGNAYKRAARTTRLSGARGRELLASILNNLGALYLRIDRLSAARQYLEEALEIVDGRGERPRNPGELSIGPLLSNLGGVERKLGNYTRAGQLYERALASQRQEFGYETLQEAAYLNNLASISLQQREWREAETLVAHAVEIWKKHLRTNHPTLGVGLTTLAQIRLEQSRKRLALVTAEEAVAILESELPDDHVDLATALEVYSRILKAAGRKREAKSQRKRSQAILAANREDNYLGHTVDISALQSARN